MVFSSYLFIFFFLPLALLGYYAAPKKLRHLTLTIFSYIFYGWANPWFCLLMLFNTSVDYTNGRLMGAYPARKKLFVTISIVCDLAILGFFKYFNFGLDNYNATMAALGIPKAQFLPSNLQKHWGFQSKTFLIGRMAKPNLMGSRS